MKKQYMFLTVDEEIEKILLLGYELKLSPTEFEILNIIFDERPIPAPLILEKLKKPTTQKSLSVHISSINKKAFDITGRKFISNTALGYRFAKYL